MPIKLESMLSLPKLGTAVQRCSNPVKKLAVWPSVNWAGAFSSDDVLDVTASFEEMRQNTCVTGRKSRPILKPLVGLGRAGPLHPFCM